MKKLLFGLVAVGFLTITFLLGGCKLGNSTPGYTEFAIQVDSIQYSDTVQYGQPLIIKFYGTIGPSTCYSFSRIIGSVSNNQADMKVLGKYTNDQNNCKSDPQYLDGNSVAVTQYVPGKFIIHVMQPSPPDIYDTVYIAPVASANH